MADLKAQNNKLQADLKTARKDDKADDKTIKGLQTTVDGYRNAGLVHVVVHLGKMPNRDKRSCGAQG